MANQNNNRTKLIVTGGNADDLIAGGAGDDTLTGGLGDDTFVVARGGGSDTITDFGPGDRLDITAFGFGDFSSFAAAAHASGADTVVSLGSGETLTLKNIQPSALTSANVALIPAPTLAPPTSPPATTLPAGVLPLSGTSSHWATTSITGTTMFGTSRNDTLTAATGNVTLEGGLGDDVYNVYNQTDLVIERDGEGIDTIVTYASSYALAGDQSLENLILAGTNAASGTGNALNNFIKGNVATNILDGGKGDDVLTGNGGTDTFVLARGGGFDTITDFAATGSGRDTIQLRGFGISSFAELATRLTQMGADTVLSLGDGDGLVLKNVALAELTENNFKLVFDGTNAADTITGGSGDDIMSGAGGRDTFVISRGAGSDTITGFVSGSGGDYLKVANYGFTNFATFLAACTQVGADTIVDLGNGETLTLKNVVASRLIAANVVFANDLSDVAVQTVTPPSGAPTHWYSTNVAGSSLTGTSGNDQMSAGAANVTLTGGMGDDIYIVADPSTTKIVEKAGEGIDTIQSWYSYALPTDQSIENLTLMGTSNLNATGNALDNLITGNSGANLITGGLGGDTFTGGGGSDTFLLVKGTGAKTITDFATSRSGADVVRLDGFGWANFEALKAQMVQIGSDVAVWLGGNDSLLLKNVQLASLTAANFSFVRTADTVVGTAAADTLNGGDGNDILSGGGGRDAFVVDRNNGSDTIVDFAAGPNGDFLDLRHYAFTTFSSLKAAMTQTGSDVVIRLSDAETLTLKNVRLADIVPSNVVLEFDLPTTGGTSKTFSTATEGATLTGTSGNDYLLANAAHVVSIGGSGDDNYCVRDQSDTVIEKPGEGVDTVLTGGYGYQLSDDQSIENVTLLGTSDTFAVGNKLDNIVTGNSGNNTLNGAGGNDILTGGAGADVFVFAKGAGSDIITDFSAAQHDQIRLDGFDLRSFADIASSMAQVGANVVISLPEGQSLVLQNTRLGDLGAQHFLFDVDKSHMVQTFNDDFDTLSLYRGTSGNWVTRYEWGGTTAYTLTSNGEKQIYVDPYFRGLPGSQADTSLGLNPFSIADGHLTITAAPTPASAATYTGGYAFTSGMLTSAGSFAQTYGYFEITADLPEGHGVWPAFWLLRADNVWPPEIDIMEAFGDENTMVHSGVWFDKTPTQNGNWQSTGDLSGEHTFSCEWTPYTITFFVDGHQTASYATPTDMNSEMFMVINLAMGGNWVGNPAADTTAHFTIDSVRAYQLTDYTLEHYRLLTSAAPTTTLMGTAGNDSITGTSGADLLDGQAGIDTLAGGLGDDTYRVSTAGTTVTEAFNAGIDTVVSSVSFALGANIENLTLTGSANANATGNGLSNIVTGNAGDNVIAGGDGNDILTGGGGHDTFVLARGDGSDIITDFDARIGAGDVAQLTGYAFSSFADVRAAMSQHGNDVYLDLGNWETLVFRDHTIGDFSADDFVLPGEPPVSAGYVSYETGTAGSDTMIGTGSGNYLDGKGGNDILMGGRGDDTYKAYAGATTTIIENAGEGVDTVESLTSYSLTDNVENLRLMTWNITGTGNDLANRIWGHGGSETLNGKGGNDWLFGGGGNDIFVYEKGSGLDTIVDFHVNTGSGERDLLKLQGYGGDATLTNDGDMWTVHYAGGEDHFQIVGVTHLGAADYLLS
jgi:Ca2+-binding RTX toxin-like protein